MKKHFTILFSLFLIAFLLPGKSIWAQVGFEIPAMTRIALELESNINDIEKLTEKTKLIFKVKTNLQYDEEQLTLAKSYAEGYIAHVEQTDRTCFKIEIKPQFMQLQNEQVIEFFPTSHFLEIGDCFKALKVSATDRRIIARVKEKIVVWVD